MAEFWSSPPGILKLSSDEVHVWRTALGIKTVTLADLKKSLSPDEHEKAARFHFEQDRLRYLIGHGVLRSLAGRYSGQPADSLRFSCNPWGKPALEAANNPGDLQFNLSHSGEYVLHAFTRGRPIGVDHERIRPDFATQEIAERFFSAAEATRLRRLPAEIQARAFFNCWTRKEAYMKGCGRGLSIGLDKFEVAFAPNQPAALLRDENDPEAIHRWSIHELKAGADYLGAVAVEGKNLKLQFWQWGE